eukprot:TRINITY_DN10151_c0_g1_i2.p1 TRINITY_DN10151_c0_g1~~TRINITY_DN10151_c0_g1_i2.p1  ORF type:complete len:317 (+),score=95.90 TRINITY_DN10151_c0_g1_i2:1685-2635(+)
MIFNAIYSRVAVFLNEYENHRTDTEYFDSLISKTFIFKFINSYNTLFYMAFVRYYEDSDLGCDSGTECLEDLAQQLGIIFGLMIFVNNFSELGVPLLKKCFRGRGEKAQTAETLRSPPERQFELETYENTVDDFDELAIQFGYVTLFVLAFPLTPLLALLNNFLEIQIDANKLLVISRRPEPRGAQDIGTWYSIFDLIALISIITNIAVAVMYMDDVDEWTDGSDFYKLLIAFCAEHIILVIRMTIDYVVPDVPLEVEMHIARQEYVVETLIKNVPEPTEHEVDDGGDGPAADKILLPADLLHDTYFAVQSKHLIT